MNKLILYITVALPMLVISYIPVKAQNAAAEITKDLSQTNAKAKLSPASVTQVVGQAIQVIVSITGVVFLIITVYAGILYLTAAGDEAKVKKAKSMLTTGVIGIVIIMMAYAIASFVTTSLSEVVGQNQPAK